MSSLDVKPEDFRVTTGGVTEEKPLVSVVSRPPTFTGVIRFVFLKEVTDGTGKGLDTGSILL